MSIILNDNIQYNAPKQADAKYMKFSGGIAQPYTSTAEAISTILLAYRYQYLTVLILMNGDPVEYWWQGSTADGSLVTKSKESYTFNSTNSIVLTTNYLYHKIAILPANNITGLIIGTSLGGTDIEPGTNLSAGVPQVYSIGYYILFPTTFYFGNLSTGTKILLYKEF
jgi:hypothetical protein